MSVAPVVYTCDEHSSVYYHLVSTGSRGVALTHLDAHCDLRATLIDRDAGVSWLRRPDLPISPSTYLSYLVAEGFVSDVDWVHDEVGGRRNDLRTVLYTSDLDRLVYKMVRRPSVPGVGIIYRESEFDAWRHRDSQRVLDIDWDFFADWRKSDERASKEVLQLLEEKIEQPPRVVYVAYSAPYSRPSRPAYRDFVDRLARRLSARIEPIAEAPIPRSGGLARALPPALRRSLRSFALRFKRAALR